MYADIYFSQHLDMALDEFEDLLEEVMGEQGEVSGTGSGEKGSNFDLYIYDDNTPLDVVVSWVKEAIEKSGCRRECDLVIGGVRYTVVP